MPPPSRRESLANRVTTAMLQDTKVLKRGELRYEKLFDEVIKARKQNGRMKHSKKYLEYRADLYKNRQSGMKKKAAADNGEEVSQKRTKCEDVVLDF